MLRDSRAFSSFSVDDLEAARDFYGGALGLDVVVDDRMGLLSVALPGGGAAIIYPKEDHSPATFTVLNFTVDDVGAAADRLAAAGAQLQRYPQFGEPDAKGVYRGAPEGMPDIAWFTDPAGNILSVVSEGPA
jgi:predicted enzyme related to lactoylglutathione lyase